VSAASRLRALGLGPGKELRALSASGQLGYGIPEKAFEEGLSRDPHFLGCDMGSIDAGPYYLGAGKIQTSDAITRRDMRLVLNAAVKRNIPLLIGTAGTAGAAPHLARTLELVREVAAADKLSFKLAIIPADIPKETVKAALAAGRTRPLGQIPDLTDATIDKASHIVGQMGVDAYIRALELDADVIIAGRACDTAIFAAIPRWLGYPMAAALHMAKIIECTSICCVPGGRDAMLGTLHGDHFVLESMNPARAATPLSVAAHSLYEQADPLTVYEPDGALHVGTAKFEAVDERRTRVSGSTWEPAKTLTVKIEGAEWVGERAIVCAGTADPRVIENIDLIKREVGANVDGIIGTGEKGKYEVRFHAYGTGAISLFPPVGPQPTPSEVFFLVECIAETADLAKAVASVTKQFLLHHGFPGRLSTGGNIAFPFTPPELAANSAYRFTVYHLMETDDLEGLFPVRLEDVAN